MFVDRRVGVSAQRGNRFVSFVRCVRCETACARGTMMLPRLSRENSRNAPRGRGVACPSPVCWLIMLDQINSTQINVRSCYIMLNRVRPCKIMLDHVTSCWVTLISATHRELIGQRQRREQSPLLLLNHVNSCYPMLVHVNSCWSMLIHVSSCQSIVVNPC